MALSKEELIQGIYRKYGLRFNSRSDEKLLIDVLAGKYHRAEVVNLSKGRKASKFQRSDLSQIPTKDIKRLAEKYSKRAIPVGVSREVVIDILLKKLSVDKLSDQELMAFGKSGRNALTGAVDLYAGWIPKVKRKVKEKDLIRGKKIARRY